MPSWPTRLFLGSSGANKSSTHEQSLHESPFQDDHLRGPNQPPTPLRSPPVPTSNNLLSTSVPRRASQHGRSISHPFPSIFGSARRRNTREEEEEVVIDAKTLLVGSGSHAADQAAFSRSGPANAEDVDLTSGKCATCDSQVRWPRQLSVFRCTACLMVNDLRLNHPKPPQEDTPSGARADSFALGTNTVTQMRVPHVSMHRTEALIDQCISRHLQLRFGAMERGDQEKLRRSLEKEPATSSNSISNDRLGVSRSKTAETITIPATNSADRLNVQNFAIASGQGIPVTQPSGSPPASPARGPSWGSPMVPSKATEPSLPFPTRPPPPPPVTLGEISPGAGSPIAGRARSDSSKGIFRSLENYIIACFNGTECLNGSFLLSLPPPPARAKSDGAMPVLSASPTSRSIYEQEAAISPLDAKTLLIGDFAENGMWWAGGSKTERSRSHKGGPSPTVCPGDQITSKSPRVNWQELQEWYHVILNAGRSWRQTAAFLQMHDPRGQCGGGMSAEMQQQVEEDFRDASLHLQRTLLKASENLLRRPGRPLKNASDCRFLLILLANPLLYPQSSVEPIWVTLTTEQLSPNRKPGFERLRAPTTASRQGSSTSRPASARGKGGTPPNHSGITKRILGLLANLPSECHHYLVGWFSRFSESRLRKLVELMSSFVTYRLSRQHGRKRSNSHDPNGGLVPSLSGAGMSSSAQLHAALGITGSKKPPERDSDAVIYSEDWQIKAAARVMSLLFSANNNALHRRPQPTDGPDLDADLSSTTSAARHRANRYGQLLPTSVFYNMLLDYSDLVADFEVWEARTTKFSFCQYPMFLSIWAKIRIMEHDARRQMEIKAREAFFDSIMNRKAVSQYLVLRVRRDCLVEDSLRGVSEVVGQGQEEIKKGLRIEFSNEEGIDAGGLRKEWFLLLVREVFDPEHGLFAYDEDSHYCYFNPNSFETSDQFYLVGVVLGLALYNSTILDVALPPFAFRKLLASAPTYTGPATSTVRSVAGYTLDDLAEFRPSLAKGLQQLLDFDGDVEATFCRDFVAEVERYGQVTQVPLCTNGQRRPVTNANRREFVDLYIRYLLDTAVSRQYEPFKRGFYTVCAGNALSLFRPEEIELLVRGSDDPLDVATLQAVATYENWGKASNPAEEAVVQWFWAAFMNADPKNQRKLLSFVTGSDRIPAMGAANLVIKVTCLGQESDIERFPTARTCFNRIGLYRYRSQEQLETKLWRAVTESEGFGMK